MDAKNTLNNAVEKLTQERSDTPELISYQTTRRAVGWLGILLPWSLWIGSYVFGPYCRLQPSISHFYFTNMREGFVGVLCAVSLFLFTYKGHSKLDSFAANAAGFFSLGVAVFPTDSITGYSCQQPVVSIITVSFHNIIHFSCAALFFITLALMSLFLFTKSKHPKSRLGVQKRKRNRVYKISGWIMLACIALIALSKPLLKVSDTSPITFWMETVALTAFGASWLTKGEVVFGDK